MYTRSLSVPKWNPVGKWEKMLSFHDHETILGKDSNSSEKIGRIEIAKQALNFSAAHFTIFTATDREDLHGHNFQVECELTSPIDENGLIFDYALIKRVVKEICDEIDEKTILPERSPFLKLEQTDDYLIGIYGDERIPFLPRDVITLPISNSSVEELSHYFLDRMLNHEEIALQDIREMTIKISSSPGQKGTATWEKT
jgi:6-pyruvoyltetrahydropterin/6-carboxytetrahydropterin synthase